MTLQEIEKSTKIMLTAADVAPLIGTDPHTLRWQAREEPAALGFPVMCVKSRVKIPRMPFLEFIRGKTSSPNGSTST